MEKVTVYQTYSGFADITKAFGAGDDVPTPDEVDDPVGEALQAAPVNAALKSAVGASIVLDMPLPPADGVDSDGEFWKAPKIIRYDAAALAKSHRTSDERFAKLTVQLQRFFGDHVDLADEAVEICRQAREDARTEAIAIATAR